MSDPSAIWQPLLKYPHIVIRHFYELDLRGIVASRNEYAVKLLVARPH
jgi:hypothetical protein